MDNELKKTFQHLDEVERVYAPEELPAGAPEKRRVQLDEEGAGNTDASLLDEPPSAAPVAAGTTPSSVMAPPNIGQEEHGGAPGDPETQARYPIGTDEQEGSEG
ncbi:MAG: hypothetical protein IVW55_14235 [Chloroflexi bacterium]|nr:hypothetical protein [Chloroflexota bacterium]